MKQTLLLFSTVLFTAVANAQTSNAVVFSENGEKFTLLLNGEKQNAAPQVNVKLSGLTADFYQARIDFENPYLQDITNNNFAVHRGFEVTYVIRQNKKGEYVLRYNGEAPAQASASAPTSDAKRFAEVDDAPVATPVTTNTTVQPGVNINTTMTGTPNNANQNVTIQETTTTKTTRPANSDQVNIGMNLGGMNMGINMNVNDSMTEESTGSTTVVTTTTTTKTTGTPPAQVRPAAPAPAPAPAPVVESRCARPMDSGAFSSAKGNISSKGFEDTKMTVAKQVTKANCLTSAQIKEVMGIFGFEDTKLEYAKFAYDFCYDKGNYYAVNDAFGFESSIDELNSFIESKN